MTLKNKVADSRITLDSNSIIGAVQQWKLRRSQISAKVNAIQTDVSLVNAPSALFVFKSIGSAILGLDSEPRQADTAKPITKSDSYLIAAWLLFLAGLFLAGYATDHNPDNLEIAFLLIGLAWICGNRP